MWVGRALIVVDMLNDFVASDGTLSCGQSGQNAVGPIVNLLEESLQQGDLIVLACDTHAPDDPEFVLWPRHCVAGTWGAQLYGPVQTFYEKHAGALVRMMPKTRYDAFFETPLAGWLQDFGATEVIVAGVCTSICCYATASGAYYRRLQVLIRPDAMGDLTEEAHDFAVRHMQAVLKAVQIS